MEITTWIGIVLGVGAILLGQVLEGGAVHSIVQGTAAIIVFGGTLGAVLVSHSLASIKLALRMSRDAFFTPKDDRQLMGKQIIEAAQVARRDSILALEKSLPNYRDPFMKTVFRFVIDGVDPATIQDIFESEISVEEENNLTAAKVLMDAGGFAPTVGIIGAVLGLIHVMENLTDTSKLGGGIAVAFVATIYGVGSANLIFIPLANKVRKRVKDRSITKDMILAGALGVLGGLNPYIIEEKLRAYYEKKVV